MTDYTIHDAPGPDAGREALRVHYRAVNNFFATHGIDAFRYLCHWCLADDVQYRPEGSRGDPKYCSARCRDAAALWFGGGQL